MFHLPAEQSTGLWESAQETKGYSRIRDLAQLEFQVVEYSACLGESSIDKFGSYRAPISISIVIISSLTVWRSN